MTVEKMLKRKKELGYSMKELAELSGVPLGTVQKIFGGKTTAPRRATILALERVLGEADRIPPVGDFRPKSIKVSPVDWKQKADWEQEADRKQPAPGMVCESFPAMPLKSQGEYTVEDYYRIPDERRVELIDGVIYDMSAPSFLHQEFAASILMRLREYVRKNQGSCRVYSAPINVQLDQDNRTMVQPDIAVFCRLEHLYKKVYWGAPDMVIEIVSPSTARKDLTIKLGKYINAGVREYWLVYPEQKRVVVYADLPENTIPRLYSMDTSIPVSIWGGDCLIDFAEIIADIGFLYDRPDYGE